jgi:hypothetical protein
MGRRTKFTAEAQQGVCDAIRLGTTYELAALSAGIAYETFNEWRKTKPQFSEALREAECAAALVWLTKIEKAATDGDWRAAAWKLERRYPNDYGRTVRQHEGKLAHEHSGPGGVPIPIRYFDAAAALASITDGPSAVHSGLAGLLDGEQ